MTDARLTAVLPADGDYVVELSDSRYQGAGRPVYRLVIGAVPMAEEVYPAGRPRGRDGRPGAARRDACRSRDRRRDLEPAVGTGSMPASDHERDARDRRPAGAPDLDVESLPPLVVSPYPELREPADPAAAPVRAVAPVVFNGRIDPPGDDDRFVLVDDARASGCGSGCEASELGSALDGVLQVLGKNGAVIANADDTNIPQPARNGQQAQSLVIPDPSLDLTVPGGTNEITLVIRDLENRGGIGFPYRIVVEPLAARLRAPGRTNRRSAFPAAARPAWA